MALTSVLRRSCSLNWESIGRKTLSSLQSRLGCESDGHSSCQPNRHWRISVRCQSSDANIVKSPYPEVVLPEIPLHHYVWQSIDKWPNHVAIECGMTGKKYTYKELHTKCKRLGVSLKNLGLKPGDTLGIVMPNIPEYPVVYLGALEHGLVASTVNPGYTKDEILYQLEHAGCKWVICHPCTLDRVKEAAKEMAGGLNIISTDDFDGSRPDGVMLLEDLVGSSVGTDISLPSGQSMEDVALIAYSSGTTGLPKGTCLTHRNITSNIEQFSQPEIAKFVETNGDFQMTVMGILPFFHCYGNVIVQLGSLRKGAKLVTMVKFDPKIFLNIISTNINQLLYLVPPLVFFLGNSPEVTEKHLRGVTEIMSGAAPCSAHDIEKIKKKSPNTVVSQGYGMTESSPVLTMYCNEGNNMATIGRLIPNTEAKVISTENGQTLGVNEIGELCFKGPQVMKGYLKNPKATAETKDNEGWLYTGDVGYYDSEGYFYITDRLKELIKVKGFQVAPAEVEEVLRKFPGVLEAGVVGIPCEKSGEKPIAFVQTKPGVKTTAQEIMDFVASQLSKHKHLASVQFLDAIPKTASGKILRKDLKKLALSQS